MDATGRSQSSPWLKVRVQASNRISALKVRCGLRFAAQESISRSYDTMTRIRDGSIEISVKVATIDFTCRVANYSVLAKKGHLGRPYSYTTYVY